MSVAIVAATAEHVRALVGNMRAADRSEIEGLGCHVRHTMHRLYREAIWSSTALVDGEVAAVWGLDGSLLDDVAYPWLFTTPAAERAPVAFYKVARAEMARMLVGRRMLVTRVAASYDRSIRLFSKLGFQIGPEYAAQPFGLPYRQMVLEQAAQAPPFIVYALPRSRTKWLSEFLSYGGWTVHHEVAMKMRSFDDVASLFRRPNVGAVETAAAHGNMLLRHHVPDLKEVVVRRRLDDAVEAMMGVDVGGVATYDRDAVRALLTRGARELDRISARPGVLTVEFDDLEREDACRALFEHCLQFKMPCCWWVRFHNENIQVDVKSMLVYFHQHRPEIEGFKRACKSELRRLAYAGLVRRRAA